MGLEAEIKSKTVTNVCLEAGGKNRAEAKQNELLRGPTECGQNNPPTRCASAITRSAVIVMMLVVLATVEAAVNGFAIGIVNGNEIGQMQVKSEWVVGLDNFLGA